MNVDLAHIGRVAGSSVKTVQMYLAGHFFNSKMLNAAERIEGAIETAVAMSPDVQAGRAFGEEDSPAGIVISWGRRRHAFMLYKIVQQDYQEDTSS